MTMKKQQRKPIPSTPQAGIAIQGYEGSFHQVAARSYFGKDVEVLPCANFRELIQLAGDKKQSSGAVMAIENSIAGSILPNYNLLLKSKLKVTGEIYLSISQNLLVHPGVRMEDIREVHSHPMALLQCLDYLEQQPWKLIETEDTALSAKLLQQKKSSHTAAIASKLAAELFDLEILAADIHTMKNNMTRFLVLEHESIAEEDEEANKASIYFQTSHEKGELANVLNLIAHAGINLSKLQSMPIPGSNFKYGFYVDMEFDEKKQLNQVLKSLSKHTNSLRNFGAYQKGKLVKG
jgi:prephenate dehydratase